MIRSPSLGEAGNARIVVTPRGRSCIGSSSLNASIIPIVVARELILPADKLRGDSVTIAYRGC
jgi:hypothetical protein